MDKNKIVSWSIIVLISALISIFVLFAPANAGVSPEEGRSIGDETNGTFAFIGETNLTFVDKNGSLIPKGYLISAWEDSNINIPFPNNETIFDSKKEAYRLLSGFYKVTDLVGVEKSRVYFAAKDEIRVETKVCGEPFSWVTRGGDITFKADTKLHNIKGNQTNNITYKLLDPDGLRVPGYSLSDIDVSENGENTKTINTAGLKTDVYTLSIETDPDTNNGLDVEGPSVTFEVKGIGVTVEAKPEEQVVTDEIVFTVSTTPHTDITLNVTRGVASNVWFEKGMGSGEVKSGGHSAFGTSDKDGNFKAVASFTEKGDYDITATERIIYTERGITVGITIYELKLTAPKEGVHYIGEVLKIKGSANVGTNMTIKIDGSTFKENAQFDDEYDWLTEESTLGTHKIEMWVLPLSDPEKDPPDDSVSIVLIRGGLFAKTSADFVALGDDFTIEGTVPGRDRVDILTIAPKGGDGKGLDLDDISNETDGDLDAPGLTHHICGITDEKFKKDKIKVSVKTDTGTYLIAVLNYGRDRVWGTSGSDNLLKVIGCPRGKCDKEYLKIKTTDQIINITKHETVNAAGSDDLLCIVTIKVENGFVTLDDIDDVPLGKNIEVTGTTNRKVDTPIIVTVEGLEKNATKLKPKFATVKADDKNFYNKFSISFDTASAKIGKYEVTADDGDGHIDTKTVNILPAVEPSVNVSATPTPGTQSQSTNKSNATSAPQIATPTATPIETEKQPGFEMIFTITGLLLAVTWLMLKVRRQKKR